MEENKMYCNITMKAALIAAGLSLAAISAAAAADPVWSRIESSGKLVCGAIPNDPVGSWQDRASGQWEGYEIELCRAIAADLSKEMAHEIQPEFKETSWGTVVLDIQSNKIDIWPGMSATAARKKAVSMVGPLYSLAICGVTAKNFSGGDTWESLNKPNVRIATVAGTSQEGPIKELTPKATHISLPEFSQVALAVQSGRADIMGADILRCLPVPKTAPDAFGRVVFPKKVYSMPSSAGLSKSAVDLTPWLQKWADKNREAGNIKSIFLKVLNKAGYDVSLVPSEVQF
jgi:polar amino acid transport system substrate-binding protein